MMRAFSIAALVWISLSALAAAEEVSPYSAVVAADGTAVHSGPGRNYYVTGRLRRGAEVEIYRHDAGGWLAIRPPDGSFSLVGTRYLRPTGDGLAVVKEDHVGARIGSLESPDRDAVQVRLSQGEEVQLLEPTPVTSPNSRQSWYMISPPAGEFRWIHESQLAGGAQAPVATARPRRLPATREERPLPPAAEDVIDLDQEADAGPTQAATLATYQIDRSRDGANQAEETATEDAGWTAASHTEPARRREPPAAERPTERAAEEPVPPRRAATPSPAAPPTRGGGLRAELDAIELALSQMVAQDSSHWDFTDINRRAERLLDQSATAVERGRSRLLLRKIARFEEIARGHAGVRASGMQSTRPVAPLDPLPDLNRSSLAITPRTRSPRASSGGSSLVGVGRLTQVTSKRPGAPSFALVDENRQVRYFVTASPGVNLRTYVGKQVEISGLSSFNSAFSKQQLTAERVDILSDSVLRR